MTTNENDSGLRTGILVGAIGVSCMLVLSIFLVLGSGNQPAVTPDQNVQQLKQVIQDTGTNLVLEDTACIGE